MLSVIQVNKVQVREELFHNTVCMRLNPTYSNNNNNNNQKLHKLLSFINFHVLHVSVSAYLPLTVSVFVTCQGTTDPVQHFC